MFTFCFQLIISHMFRYFTYAYPVWMLLSLGQDFLFFCFK